MVMLLPELWYARYFFPFGSLLEAVFCSACPLIVKSICKLMRIGRWSETGFVFVCQLVEVIREADANETSVGDGLAVPDSLVGESQL